MVNLPRSGWPTKFTPKQHRGGEKEARTTSKQLQALPVSLKVRVHDTTIRKGLGKNDIYGEKIKMKTTADQKELKDSSHICQKIILMSSNLALITCVSLVVKGYLSAQLV